MKHLNAQPHSTTPRIVQLEFDSYSEPQKDTLLDSQTPNDIKSKIIVLPVEKYEGSGTVQNIRINTDTSENGKYIKSTSDDEIKLTSYFETEDFESGLVYPSEKHFRKLIEKDRYQALNILSKLFMDNYSLDGRKICNLVGTLHLISHLSYEEVYPIGQMIAISALSHQSKMVSEYGIKCFENWGHIDGVEKLQAVAFSSKWLNDYAQQVINDLNEGE